MPVDSVQIFKQTHQSQVESVYKSNLKTSCNTTFKLRCAVSDENTKILMEWAPVYLKRRPPSELRVPMSVPQPLLLAYEVDIDKLNWSPLSELQMHRFSKKLAEDNTCAIGTSLRVSLSSNGSYEFKKKGEWSGTFGIFEPVSNTKWHKTYVTLRAYSAANTVVRIGLNVDFDKLPTVSFNFTYLSGSSLGERISHDVYLPFWSLLDTFFTFNCVDNHREKHYKFLWGNTDKPVARTAQATMKRCCADVLICGDLRRKLSSQDVGSAEKFFMMMHGVTSIFA